MPVAWLRGGIAQARPWQVAVLVFVAAFCLYGLTTSQQPQGYEAETTAVAEGLARTGDFVILPDSPLRDAPNAEGYLGKDGKLIGRAGVPNPLIKTPFYLAGWGMDELGSGGEQYTWRNRVMWFALPAVAALAVAFFFLVVWRLRRSMAWAIALAAVFAVASLAWPYSKAGQETVLMMSSILTFAAVLYAQESRSWRPWAAAGFGAGLVLADKPYGIVAVAAMLALLIKPLSEADRETRGRYLLAFALPLLAWAAMFGLYNWTRTGGVLDTGRSDPGFTLAAPFNFLGFFISPGKGLIFYSPVVVLGMLGLRGLFREQPRVAWSLVGAVVGGTLVVATLPFWSDESWGPRYIVWLAWLLLLPVPWWARSAARRRVLGACVALAIAIQFLAVVAPPPGLVVATKDLTGQPIFHRTPPKPLVTPFGRDPIRWIPELSPLLFQAKLVLSKVSTTVGGPAITTVYAPYEGPVHKVTLDAEKQRKYGFGGVYFWWRQGGTGIFGLVALLLLATGAAAAVLLLRAARATGWREPESAPAP